MYQRNPEYIDRIERFGQTAGLPLFEQQPQRKPIPQWLWNGNGLSAEAHKRIKNSVTQNQNLLKVLEAILTLGGSATDREIQELTGLEINIITARRNDLKKLGWVTSYPDKKKKDPETGANNTLWFADFNKIYNTIY